MGEATLNVITMTQRLLGVGTLQADEAANDSDKSFTVPTNKVWDVQSIWVELITTATVGNREVTVEFQDSAADVIATVHAGIVQAASLTCNYLFAPGLPDLVAFRSTDFLMNPIPRLLLPEAFIVRVYDVAAIAAAADDMVVQMMVVQLDEA